MIYIFKDDKVSHDISHLQPFIFNITGFLNEEKGTTWKSDIEVLFGWHCYTRKPEENESVHVVRRGKELRCFCSIRYKHSLKLPEIIKDFTRKKTFQTGKGNYITIETIDEDGTSFKYEIYFHLKKQSKKQPLKLFIESAYVPKKERIWQKRKRQSIRFEKLARNVKMGKPIRYTK